MFKRFKKLNVQKMRIFAFVNFKGLKQSVR
jgi:hypothetical protein